MQCQEQAPLCGCRATHWRADRRGLPRSEHQVGTLTAARTVSDSAKSYALANPMLTGVFLPRRLSRGEAMRHRCGAAVKSIIDAMASLLRF